MMDSKNNSSHPERVLVIGAHPDDAVLGCGGVIVRYSREGKEVYLCVATRAYTPDWSPEYVANQMKELENSNRILGVKKTYYLDFPAAKLDTVPQKVVNDTLWGLVNEVRPQVIYVNDGDDLNADHRLLFESALVATRPVNGYIRRVLSYSTSEWGPIRAPFSPNVYIDITDTFEAKIRALMCFASEIRPYPHPRSPEIIKALTEKRGSEAGIPMAEAFRLIREVI
jgi:LmbE family N-acetylglucosaminyl deacetylase